MTDDQDQPVQRVQYVLNFEEGRALAAELTKVVELSSEAQYDGELDLDAIIERIAPNARRQEAGEP